ncbi:MAG: LPS assembly lipoprotein LptE [Burkholderiaceae bacterium]
MRTLHNPPLASTDAPTAASAAPAVPASAAAPNLHRRRLLGRAATLAGVVAPALALSACGFRLRGVPEFAFRSLYIMAPPGMPLARELQRTIESSGSSLQLVTDPAAMPTAEVILELLSARQERVVVGRNASGEVRELELRLRVQFRLRTPTGVELIPPTELLQKRDISYSESIALAKEAEEALLVRNMQTDVVQQLMRRLAAVRMP